MAGPLTQDMTDRLTGRRKRKRPLIIVGLAMVLFAVATVGRCVAVSQCEEEGGTWDNGSQSCVAAGSLEPAPAAP